MIGGVNPCSKDCPTGSYIIPTSNYLGLSKCWSCHKCTGNTVSYKVNSNQCVKCQDTQRAVENNTKCEPVPKDFIHPNSTEFLTGSCLSALAVLVKISSAVLIYAHRNRAVIKASDPFFCYLIIGSLMLGDILTVLTLLEPSSITCKLEMYLCAFFLCSTCSNLFYRSLKIYKIFMAAANFRRSTKIFKFLNPRAQCSFLAVLLGTTAGLVQIPILSNGWLYEEVLVPGTIFYKTCRSHKFVITLLPFVIPCLLMLGTLILAYKMRLFPHNFKETTKIFNTCLILVIICLIFLSGYSISEYSIQSLLRAIIYFCISQTFHLCLFAPKFIVLLNNEDVTESRQSQLSFNLPARVSRSVVVSETATETLS